MSVNRRTEYLNVDLDIVARHSLKPLVDALGDRVSVNYVGKQGSRYLAVLELPGVSLDPSKTILKMVSLVDSLRGGPRRRWRDAQRRTFNIGVQAGDDKTTFELPVNRVAISAAQRVAADLVLTVYGSGLLPARIEPEQEENSRARKTKKRGRG